MERYATVTSRAALSSNFVGRAPRSRLPLRSATSIWSATAVVPCRGAVPPGASMSTSLQVVPALMGESRDVH